MKTSQDSLVVYEADKIQRKIYTIRNIQVMLDTDLAVFYGLSTKVLNQAVKRNIDRFPPNFMFQITKHEKNELVTNCDHLAHLKFSSALPKVFTEQGVAMLSGVLRSDTAIKISIQIINAFVSMRKFLVNNASVFQKIDNMERKHLRFEIETNEKFEKVFNALQNKDSEPRQGIFYDGQIFDAYKFVSSLIRKAEKSIILIDNYIDETVLSLFTKRKKNVIVTIFTREISKLLSLDIAKFNSQYQPVEVKEFKISHDRFMIIDNRDVYHFGASLKDLGKKWFAFSRFHNSAIEMLRKLNERNK